MRETLALYPEPPEHPWWAEAVHGVRPATPDELPRGYGHGLRFTVPLADMSVHLPWLLDEVERRGAVSEMRHLTSLRRRRSRRPRGLLRRPRRPHARRRRQRRPGTRTDRAGGEPRPHALGPRRAPSDGRAYVHPRVDDVILGGTLDEGEWDDTPDPDTAAAIVARCTDLAPALADAPVLEHVAGLRPGRPTVRLERGADLADGTPLIHH